MAGSIRHPKYGLLLESDGGLGRHQLTMSSVDLSDVKQV